MPEVPKTPAEADCSEYFDLDDPDLQVWRYHNTSPQPRSRPSYSQQLHVSGPATKVLLASTVDSDNLDGLTALLDTLAST